MLKRIALSWMAVIWGAGVCVSAAEERPGYAIVVSQKSQVDPAWREVVGALQAKHAGRLVLYSASVDETLAELQTAFPKYVCFVAPPDEVTREFVASVHQLARRFDSDPYTDCFWGILTGYDADNALRIARHREPLVVRKVAGGTELALEMVEEGVWYCELNRNKMVRKEPGGVPQQLKGPDDTTEALAKSLTEYQADLFVTSGHATERDWQIGFSYPNGSFRCEHGALFGLDTQGHKFPIHSPNPKVYMPVGNCLMGHIDSRDAMALAFLNSAGVMQMFGYTVPTWYGYGGWGCLDYFLEQPGRYTFTEAFFANQVALTQRLSTYFPAALAVSQATAAQDRAPFRVEQAARAAGLNENDARGLQFDRDVVAFYGDPAWSARMADGPRAWEQTLQVSGDAWVFEIKPKRAENSFAPINTNGSQRGGRPLIQFLPRRIQAATVLEGADLQPVITDDFILVPNPHPCDPRRSYRVVFRAAPIE